MALDRGERRVSLSLLETAVAEYVGGVLVDECGRPEPDRILRYHGRIPADCCTDNGYLAINWESVRPKDPGGQVRGNPCLPTATLAIRYVTCWPEPELEEIGTDARDDEWDAQSAMYADVADCVARALCRVGCAQRAPDELTDVLARCQDFAFLECVPIPPEPSGLGGGAGCAGVLWRVRAGVKSTEAGT